MNIIVENDLTADIYIQISHKSYYFFSSLFIRCGYTSPNSTTKNIGNFAFFPTSNQIEIFTYYKLQLLKFFFLVLQEHFYTLWTSLYLFSIKKISSFLLLQPIICCNTSLFTHNYHQKKIWIMYCELFEKTTAPIIKLLLKILMIYFFVLIYLWPYRISIVTTTYFSVIKLWNSINYKNIKF